MVQIDVLTGWSAGERDTIADCVQEALVAELGVPERDRFQLVAAHEEDGLRFDRGYLDAHRTERFVLVRVTLSAGRSTAAKQAFFATLARLLAERVGLPGDDLAIVLTENAREDWSFAGGRASYLELTPDRWR